MTDIKSEFRKWAEGKGFCLNDSSMPTRMRKSGLEGKTWSHGILWSDLEEIWEAGREFERREVLGDISQFAMSYSGIKKYEELSLGETVRHLCEKIKRRNL